MGLWVREGGGFDQRSPAIQDGRVQILPSGMPIGVHDCMRNLVDESPNHDVFGEIDHGPFLETLLLVEKNNSGIFCRASPSP